MNGEINPHVHTSQDSIAYMNLDYWLEQVKATTAIAAHLAVPVTPDHIALVAVPGCLPINNTSTLTATVYDAASALLAGQVVTFTSSGSLGRGALIPLTATTNVQGQAMAVISSTLTGVKHITITAYNAVVASTTVTFYMDIYLPIILKD
jgi:hypothetical protein